MAGPPNVNPDWHHPPPNWLRHYEYHYDQLHRRDAVTTYENGGGNAVRTVSYVFDPKDRVTRITGPEGVIDYL